MRDNFDDKTKELLARRVGHRCSNPNCRQPTTGPQIDPTMEAFDKAIEDTITAINTGCLRSRDGVVLAQAKGKSYLSNSCWRERMDVIVDLLRAVRSRYALAVEQRQIHFGF